VQVSDLVDAGWALPRALRERADGRAPSWTLVGTVGSPVATPVDPAGLVVGDGWSLDWWVGADDRWHVPSREPSVRQGLIGDVPIVETRARIPGGDAVHRAFGIRSPRGTGDEWVVVEVENATPVPFAVALAIRPTVADALGSASEITIEPTGGGQGRDVPHLVRIDGRPALVLPRRPNRMAVGNRASGDALAIVLAGEAGEELLTARCPEGLATAAFVVPLPHTAVLRVALPVGEVDPAEAIAFPSVIPDAPTVASGWEVHGRGPRTSLPERKLEVAFDRSARALLLAHDGEGVHRDGGRAPDLEPGATEVLLGALDALDRPNDVGPVIVGWVDRLADPTPGVDAVVLAAVARHWRLHRIDALLEWVLPDVAAAVERIDRARRRDQISDPVERRRIARSLRAAATMLADAGQPDAAPAVLAVAEQLDVAVPVEVDAGAAASPVERLVALEARLAAGEPAAVSELEALVGEASLTGAWAGVGASGRAIGHDLAASAAAVLAIRALLVADGSDGSGGLALLPTLPPSWYGGGIELHDAPTAHGRLSYAVRWHGPRPALLWELEPHEGAGPVRLTAPGLDPAWSSTEARGEALLAEVAPPEGYELYQQVPDHPDIDPVMRRPGDDPGPPPPPASLPDGGSFS
jgi:hypothetical protein